MFARFKGDADFREDKTMGYLKIKDKNGKTIGVLRDGASEPEMVEEVETEDKIPVKETEEEEEKEEEDG